MPDLSAYLNIDITLNFATNKIEVRDVSTYPAGVESGIVGIISTRQPDGIPVEGNWANPDISYSGTVLTTGEVELRLRSNAKPQQGTYVVEYTVDHPSYTPTKITKTFNLSYEGASVDIQRQFDVFTPSLAVQDGTDYSKSGFGTPAITRLWSAQIGSVATIAGASASLDLVYSSNYYDAQYNISLAVDLEYQHLTYTYLTVVDRRAGVLQTTANTPPSYTTLLAYLKTIKERFDGLQSCAKTTNARQDYEYATALLFQIKTRICTSDLVGLYDQIQDFVNVYNQHVTSTYTNTNTAIPAYDYSDVDCGNSGATTDARITSTMINNWNAAYNSIPPDDLEYEVGVTPGAPTAGSATFSPAGNVLVNRRVRLLVNKIKISKVDWQGNPYFSKPYASNVLTLTGMTWSTGDLVQIECY